MLLPATGTSFAGQGERVLVYMWEGALNKGCCSALRFSTGQLMDAAAESSLWPQSWLLAVSKGCPDTCGRQHIVW